jgi:hypothetical protein
MSSFLNQSNMTLKERLSHHVGFSVAIHAKGISSQPGLLQKVGRQFFKVNNQYFSPLTLEYIALLGFPPNVTGEEVHIRSTTQGNFTSRLVRTGHDFIEVLLSDSNPEWLLIPLNAIISLEKKIM